MEEIIEMLERGLAQRKEEINSFQGLFKTLPPHRHETIKSAIRCNEEFISGCTQALSLLHSENRKGVSDALPENGDLHAVRKWNAPSPSGEGDLASVAGALGKRIKSEIDCKGHDMDYWETDEFGNVTCKCGKAIAIK